MQPHGFDTIFAVAATGQQIERDVAQKWQNFLAHWKRYRANSGGSLLTALDQVLQNHYATTLANEFQVHLAQMPPL